jgi:hypothetical protein
LSDTDFPSTCDTLVLVADWGEAGEDLESLGSAVEVSEDVAPLPAEDLVVVAVSSMGKALPTDCASFTTSWVICSAITIFVTIVRI